MHYRSQNEYERIYRAIKARALAFGFDPGKPIRIGPLAAQMGVSATPIRAILHMLAEEGLATWNPQKGFQAMPLSNDRFAGMYQLNQCLLDGAVTMQEADDDVLATASSSIAGTVADLATGEDNTPDAIAAHTGVLFSCLAQLSGNEELVYYVERINEWLHFVRTLEAEQLDNVPGELIAIGKLFLTGHREEMVEALDKYHTRRLILLPKLLPAIDVP